MSMDKSAGACTAEKQSKIAEVVAHLEDLNGRVYSVSSRIKRVDVAMFGETPEKTEEIGKAQDRPGGDIGALQHIAQMLDSTIAGLEATMSQFNNQL